VGYSYTCLIEVLSMLVGRVGEPCKN